MRYQSLTQTGATDRNSFCKTFVTLFGAVLRPLQTRMYLFVDDEFCQNKTGDDFHVFCNSFQMLDDFQNLTGLN